MNNFYVYVYLDPRKSGQYKYGEYEFDYEPFYVGKGKGRRYKRTDNRRSNYFKNKVNKIKEFGLKPLVIKLKENLNENNSFILEIELIKSIGRKDLNKGPLLNFTDGGEGSSGFKHSEKYKIKMSKLLTDNSFWCGKHIPKEIKNKISKSLKGKYCGKNHPMYGYHHTEKIKNKLSILNQGENNPRSILKEKDVIKIKTLLKEGKLTQKEIAKMFNVDGSTICNIKKGKTWKNLNINNMGGYFINGRKT